MKLKSSLKKRCKYCKIIKRKSKIYNICTIKKHKLKNK